jgi:hypothetical protein
VKSLAKKSDIMDTNTQDLAFLQEVTRQAGAIALDYFNKGAKSWAKTDNSPVTEADLAVDAFLKQLNLKPVNHFYEPCSHVEIIQRVLRNLISAYEKLSEVEKVEELREMLGIFPEPR